MAIRIQGFMEEHTLNSLTLQFDIILTIISVYKPLISANAHIHFDEKGQRSAILTVLG
jgi:hypothetical protein